jgi:O-antigen/teichoic acid export membrane protein
LKRKFVLNILFLITVSVIVKAFWVLGIDRSVQNLAGEEEYGFYFSLFSFSVLFTLLLDLGIAGFNNRSVSTNPSIIRTYFSNILVIRIIASVIYFIITLLAALLLHYSEKQIFLLLVLMINQIIASITVWLRSNISGLQHFFLDSILSVSERFIMIILCSLLLWGGITSSPFRIEWFVYVQTFAYIFVMLISFFIVVRMGHIKSIRIDLKVMSSIVKAGIPYAFVALFMTLYWRMDSVMIERLLPDGRLQAGTYAQSFRLFDAFSMIPVMFGGMLLPLFSRSISCGQDLRPIVSIALKMLLVPAGILVSSCILWPGEILDLLYKSPSHESAIVFCLLMITLLPVSLIYIYSTLLTASGNMKTLALITGSATVVNMVLNFILIPRFTITGSAVSSLVSQSFVAFLCVIMVNQKMFPVRTSKITILFCAMVGVTLLTGFICRRLQMSWLPGMALQLIVGVLWVLSFRMIEPLKAIRLISEKP